MSLHESIFLGRRPVHGDELPLWTSDSATSVFKVLDRAPKRRRVDADPHHGFTVLAAVPYSITCKDRAEKALLVHQGLDDSDLTAHVLTQQDFLQMGMSQLRSKVSHA